MRRSFIKGKLDQALCLFSDIKTSVYNITNGNNPEDYIYIMPLGGFGELILTASQTHHLRNKNNKIVLIVQNERNWIAKLYPEAADLYLGVNKSIVEALSEMEDLSFLMKGHLFISYITWLADARFADQLILRDRLLNFKQGFAFMLNLELDLPTANPRNLSIDVSKYGYISEKSVLIVPHANFTRNFKKNFWVSLIKELILNGYTIYYDLFNQEKLEILNIINIQTDVLEFLSLAKKFKHVIMLRSGLSDMLTACAYQAPDMQLHILWNIDPIYQGTLFERTHSPGCTHGECTSKVWFDNQTNVFDYEVNELDKRCIENILLRFINLS